MRTASKRIKCGFDAICDVLDELSHPDRAWNACMWGESVREMIDDAIRTYKHEVERMNEKVENLKAKLQQLYVDVDKDTMIEK